MSLFFSLNKQIDQWQSRGVLDSATAQRLRDDVRANTKEFGVGGVLAILGAIMLGAALILFVAANWEVIPRIWRVALILAVMWGGYLGGAWLQYRAASRPDAAAEPLRGSLFAPALYLLAALTYGAGIALIGQMYHMSGDLTTAALAWGGGVLVAAFLLRAPILCAAALGIGGFYLYSVLNELSGQINLVVFYRWIMPLYIAACAAAMLYTKADKAMHLLAMLVLAYILCLYVDMQSPAIAFLMVLVGLLLVLLQGRWPAFERYSFGFGAQLAGYGLVASLLGLLILQIEHTGVMSDNGFGYSLAAIGLCVIALILTGEKSGPLRWFAYAGFSLHVLYLASVTIGTMIGTAGVFLIGGLLIMLLAYCVSRMETYLRNTRAAAAVAQAAGDDKSGLKP